MDVTSLTHYSKNKNPKEKLEHKNIHSVKLMSRDISLAFLCFEDCSPHPRLDFKVPDRTHLFAGGAFLAKVWRCREQKAKDEDNL